MIIKKISVTMLAIILPVLIYGQKLPNVQPNSVRAPENIKIDGRASEVDNQFQAYNNATNIFYTISNDDKNLYLTLQATDHTVINKILGGGIVFTIDTSDEKNSKNGMKIIYPILDMHNRVWVDLKDQPQGNSGPEALKADSIMNVKNRDLANKSKTIGIAGIKGLDTLISVYNHDGVKAAATFNRQLFFTYELSIDIKKLGLNLNNETKFNYNIKLPGVDMVAVYAASGQATSVTPQGFVVPVGPLPGFTEEYFEKNLPSLPYKVHVIDFTSSTNFSGKYTLAKK
jgi:hypothetical protein